LVVIAAAVAVVLVFLTPLFYFLPKASLAAIILVAVIGLIDIDYLRFLWRCRRIDLAIVALTFAATLTMGIALGIIVGIVAARLLALMDHS
ncbi:MAG: SulP family inorganic anion transporter, partial [Myxococcota bacterium]